MNLWVTVVYREPTWADRADVPVEDRRWTYLVEAPSATAAIETARQEFLATTALSGVGWVREIVRWEVSSSPPR